MGRLRKFIPFLLILIGIGLVFYLFSSGRLALPGSKLEPEVVVPEEDIIPLPERTGNIGSEITISSAITETVAAGKEGFNLPLGIDSAWLKKTSGSVFTFFRRVLLPEELLSFVKNALAKNWEGLIPDAESFLYTFLQTVFWFLALRWLIRKFFGKPAKSAVSSTKGFLGTFGQLDGIAKLVIFGFLGLVVTAIFLASGNDTLKNVAQYLWILPTALIVVAIAISLFEKLDELVKAFGQYLDGTVQGLGKIVGNGTKLLVTSGWTFILVIGALALCAGIVFPKEVLAISSKATIQATGNALSNLPLYLRAGFAVSLLGGLVLWLRPKAGRRPRPVPPIQEE